MDRFIHAVTAFEAEEETRRGEPVGEVWMSCMRDRIYIYEGNEAAQQRTVVGNPA